MSGYPVCWQAIKKGKAESALPLWMMVLFQQPAIENAMFDRLPPGSVILTVLLISMIGNQLNPCPDVCGT